MKLILIVAVALLPAWSAVSAQSDRDVRVRVTAGAELRPQYPGADTDKIGPLFYVSIAHGTDLFKFKAPDDSAGLALVSTKAYSFGVAGNLVGARRDRDVGAPVGRVPSTFEAGVYAGYRFGGTFRIRGEILKGIGGHNGVRAQLGADRIWRDGDRFVFSLGPRLLIADSRYERAYFGVSPAAALASGLPAYRPSGGIYGVAAASGLSLQLSSHWGLYSYARYERLIGDAGKSPVVRRFGSRNQVSGGLGLSYTFSFRRGSLGSFGL